MALNCSTKKNLSELDFQWKNIWKKNKMNSLIFIFFIYFILFLLHVLQKLVLTSDKLFSWCWSCYTVHLFLQMILSAADFVKLVIFFYCWFYESHFELINWCWSIECNKWMNKLTWDVVCWLFFELL